MIGLIVARSKNNVIGKNGGLPWNIEGELQQFKKLTTGKIVVMGRKTFESIGHPLSNRKNIVISGTVNYSGENLITVKTLNDAIKIAGNSDIYISGGYRVYKEAIPLADEMYITEIDIEVENGDTFFPEFDKSKFEVFIGQVMGSEIKYTRTVYKRIKR